MTTPSSFQEHKYFKFNVGVVDSPEIRKPRVTFRQTRLRKGNEIINRNNRLPLLRPETTKAICKTGANPEDEKDLGFVLNCKNTNYPHIKVHISEQYVYAQSTPKPFHNI